MGPRRVPLSHDTFRERPNRKVLPHHEGNLVTQPVQEPQVPRRNQFRIRRLGSRRDWVRVGAGCIFLTLNLIPGRANDASRRAQIRYPIWK